MERDKDILFGPWALKINKTGLRDGAGIFYQQLHASGGLLADQHLLALLVHNKGY